jgi:peptide/nickel transport system substrate-binding protein
MVLGRLVAVGVKREGAMPAKEPGIKRRTFLKRSAVGLGVLASNGWPRLVLSASRERLMILSSIGLDALHPYAHSSGPQYGIWQHMIEPLVEVDYKKKDYYGVLAESWKFQGNSWVFHLRKGVRFHNGLPFTAQDVVHSVNRIKNDKRSLQKSNFDDLTEIQAPDDHTVVFTTAQPNAVLLDRLQNRFIVSKIAAEKYGDEADQHAIGTGPYKFVSWQRDGNLVMTRNDEYWGSKAAIKEIVLRKVGEDAGRMAGLLAGQGDVVNNVPVEEIARLDKHPRVRAEKVEGLRMYFLAMNVTHKPFDNKLVRQAFNYAVDPTAVIKHIYEGNGYVMSGPLGANVIGYDPTVKRYPYDPKRAKELLAKAGFTNGLEIKLHFSPDRYPKAKEVCQVIADQLARAGVKTELVSQEFAIFWGSDGVNGGKIPFYYVGRPAIDADTVYDQYYRSGRTKRVSFHNPEVDRLIDEQHRTGDQKKRIALLQQIGRILMEEAALVPLYTLAEIYGVARNVIWKAHPEEKVLAFDMKIR